MARQAKGEKMSKVQVPLHLFNPTPHTRTQWVLYGSTEPHNVFGKLPRSASNRHRLWPLGTAMLGDRSTRRVTESGRLARDAGQ